MANSKFGRGRVRIQPAPKVCKSKHVDHGPPESIHGRTATIAFFHAAIPIRQVGPLQITLLAFSSVGTGPWTGYTETIDSRRIEAGIIPMGTFATLTVREYLVPAITGYTEFQFVLPKITDVGNYSSNLVTSAYDPPDVPAHATVTLA
jgi:hypothetical protein